MTVAEVIEASLDEIVRTWSVQAARGPSARGLGPAEVVGAMRHYLLAVADRLRTEPSPPAGQQERRLAEQHLSDRLRQGANLDEIVHEYIFLGDAVARAWQRLEPAVRPAPDDIERFFVALNQAITWAVSTFSQHMIEDEQGQKRYLRLLDQIGDGALVDGAPPLHDRLDPVVALFRDALHCDTAAIVLYAPESDRLTMAASVGIEGEHRGEYGAALGSDAFVAHVARADEGVTFSEGFTDDVEVSAALARSGIQTLLGYPLRARGSLIGVVYVGLRERRPFLPRESRRMGALTSRLALLLDNASLFQQYRTGVLRLEAERAARERFVSALAHDLRGPMSAARLAAQVLIRHPERFDDRRDLARRIEVQLERADRMIRDLLDANRIRAGQRLPLRVEPCDLAQIGADVVRELEVDHPGRVLLRAPDQVRGFWSEDELRRAIWNLATNGLKHGAPDRPVVVAIGHDGDAVVVAVHNEGPALGPAEREMLFQPYVRSRAADARGGRGWGLGLTLVRGVAESHGGRVHVESEPEAGTTFTLRLPLDARPYQPADSDGPADGPHAAHP